MNIENINTYSVKGSQVYMPILYPEIEIHNLDKYTISIDGDRLDNLSSEFYNTTDNWWVIAIANNLPKHTLYIEPGLQLRIPYDIDKILNDYNLLNVSI